MPYRRNADLPASVKNALPQAAQTVWRNIFNATQADGASEQSSMRQAWGGLKNQGWKKDDETGKWHKVEKRLFSVPISKVEDDQHLVFGWANVSSQNGEILTDTHDDQIDIADLEKAAYEFNLYFRETGVHHTGDAVGRVVESFVVTPEKLEKMGLDQDALPMGWWLGVQVEDDETFEKVKKGKLSMFSIQGTAVREEV